MVTKLLVVVVGLFFVFHLLLSAGDLDPTFSQDGKRPVGVAVPVLSSEYYVQVQPDGKIVTLSAIITRDEVSRLYVHRFNVNGSTDNSFHLVEFSVRSCCVLNGQLSLQSDGKIVVLAETNNTDNHPILLRYRPDGSLDTSFAAATNFKPSGYGARFTDVRSLSGGKTLLAGYLYIYSPPAGYANYGAILTRLNSNGSLDTGFGSGGVVADLFLASDPSELLNDEYPVDVATNGSGKIFVTAKGGSVRRYSQNGNLEAVFTPPVCPNCFQRVQTLAIQPDGKIVAAGALFEGEIISNDIFYLVRYNPNGVPDSSFGRDGQVWTDFGNEYSDLLKDLVLQPNGKIIAVGSSNSAFALARYNPDGSLDSTFGINGKVITSDDNENVITSADSTPDGKLVVIGGVSSAPGMLERFLLNNQPLETHTNWLWLPWVHR